MTLKAKYRLIEIDDGGEEILIDLRGLTDF
jgi:hypothetical protein